MGNWQNYVEKFNENDEEIMIQSISNAHTLEWIEKEVPKFECPDSCLEETYYFRWWTFRKNIKETPGGRIITEFLPNVWWAGPYNSINSASGHHLAEARWLKQDKDLAKDYIRFWLRGEGNEISYSSWLIYSIYQYSLVTGDRDTATELLPEMLQYFEKIEENNLTKYGMFWSYDDRDAMEESISGSGLRPTLNSYMYANAFAVSKIAKWKGEQAIAEKYAGKAADLKKKINTVLWDEVEEFFKVIPQEQKDDRIDSFRFEDIPLQHNVREAIGYIPWSYMIPDEKMDIAWKFLQDKRYFKAKYGPTTAERNHPDFMKSGEHECLWNGPSWPFATTQILNSMIETLQHGRQEYIDKEDFLDIMRTYAESHYRNNDKGMKINWIDENLEPDTGEWLSREILKEWNWREDKGGYERGKDYNHSAFCDLVIRGLCGIQISESDILSVKPLIPEDTWDYFKIEDVSYRGHKVSVIFDKDGNRYGQKKGLSVYVDGVLKGHSDEIDEITTAL